MLTVLSWAAIIALAFSYWLQVWKIHVHKEVRDISLGYYMILAVGVTVLTFTAWAEGTTIFFVKQILVLVPVCVTIWQIFYHRKDRWHDDHDPYCSSCRREMEPQWKYCPFCGSK